MPEPKRTCTGYDRPDLKLLHPDAAHCHEQHPLSKLLPPYPPEEFAALKEDVRQRRQQKPCYLYEGTVLVGWHRYRACLDLGIEPWIEELPQETDAAATVLSEDLCRRHMDKGQKAAVWPKMADFVPALGEYIRRVEEESRQRKKRKPHNGCTTTRPSSNPSAAKSRSATAARKMKAHTSNR